MNKSSTNRERVNKGGAIKLNPGHLKHNDQTFAPISILPSHSSPDRGFVIEFLETSERDVSNGKKVAKRNSNNPD